MKIRISVVDQRAIKITELCNSCCWYQEDDETCMKYPWEKVGVVTVCDGYVKVEDVPNERRARRNGDR